MILEYRRMILQARVAYYKCCFTDLLIHAHLKTQKVAKTTGLFSEFCLADFFLTSLITGYPEMRPTFQLFQPWIIAAKKIWERGQLILFIFP
jgi:hypothetical protein